MGASGSKTRGKKCLIKKIFHPSGDSVCILAKRKAPKIEGIQRACRKGKKLGLILASGLQGGQRVQQQALQKSGPSFVLVTKLKPQQVSHGFVFLPQYFLQPQKQGLEKRPQPFYLN